MSSKFQISSKPKLACEISADRVLAGRICGYRRDGRDVRGARIVAGQRGSRSDREQSASAETVCHTDPRHAGQRWRARSRDVIAVLPDAAVRVALLDFDSLPAKRDEAEGVVRFRLKKSLPFDVDKAKVSYHVQTSRNGVRVVAAVALTSVIEDYEAAFRAGGLQPRESCCLRCWLRWARLTADRPTLVVKVDARTTSIAILDEAAIAAVPHAGKYSRRDHLRRATGGRNLSLDRVFQERTNSISTEFMLPGFQRRSSGSGVASANGSRSARTGGHSQLGWSRQFGSAAGEWRESWERCFPDASRYQSRDSSL